MLGAAAGCVGGGGEPVSLTNTLKAIVIRYYHAADQADTRELFLDRATPLVHTVSTLDLKLRVDTERIDWQRAKQATVKTVQLLETGLEGDQLVERVGFLGEELRPFFPMIGVVSSRPSQSRMRCCVCHLHPMRAPQPPTYPASRSWSGCWRPTTADGGLCGDNQIAYYSHDQSAATGGSRLANYDYTNLLGVYSSTEVSRGEHCAPFPAR
jgi:hypothetical protein